MTTTGQKYVQLFSGRTDAYGLGVGRIVKEPVVDELYRGHLAGEGSGIGIFPLRDDGTVNFAVIDIDKPDFDLAETLQMFLPGQTWIERSRSGNAHVWAFFERPIDGWIPRGLMKYALEAVGEPNVEVFPKQDRLLEGMVGNYINLPMHGEARPMLARDQGSGPLTEVPRALWIEAAHQSRIDPEDWEVRARSLKIDAPEDRAEAAEQGSLPFLHDCAVHILKNRETNPVRAGHRSVVFFSVAKQLLNYRDMSDDEALTLLLELNAAADPPVDEREVRRIFNNARKGGFVGTGCDDPLMADYVLPDCPIARG